MFYVTVYDSCSSIFSLSVHSAEFYIFLISDFQKFLLL